MTPLVRVAPGGPLSVIPVGVAPPAQGLSAHMIVA